MPEPPLPEPPPTLIERVAALEARLAALEANVTQGADTQPDPAELGQLQWFLKHGRRRPW